MVCGHCGSEHAPGTVQCPRTGDRLDAPGPIGSRIDRYQVLRLLGQGGFGSVYRARHVHTDVEVALKVLKKQLNADQTMIERFLREAKAAAAVGSENIVRVLDAGVASDGTAFLAMELLDGWDLKELLAREGPQEPRRLVGIILQVLDALAAAHAKGIVHRDMKPANVFVTRRVDASGAETDFVKLLDFGISKMQSASDVAGLTMTGVAMGTPAYMAPEQFFDARAVDGRADLYSVAVMLYELLGGRLPIEAQSYAELIVKVKNELPAPLASVQPMLPPQLTATVDRGLLKEKDARWPTARDFSHALRAGLGVTPAAAPVTQPPLQQTATPATANDASLMFGKTSTPTPATPAPVVNTGWVVQAPAPVVQAPAAAVAKKSSTGKIVLIVMAALGASLFLCCVLGNLANGQGG
ncbi:MAG: serine/threonine protein kinase [Archangiaceae bacterium]|nr:serine/threonine protein kinase [Archangiaceae bacterium]